jgi:hypothetical protein
MNSSLAVKSLLLFGLSIVFLMLLTLFESSLLGLSDTAERFLSALLLIVPGIIGIALGGLSLQRKERKTGMAVAGILLNALFALFHLFVLSFAG